MFFSLFLSNCKAQESVTTSTIKNQPKYSKIKLGIDVLSESNFKLLKGKRVGLITNPTGVNNELKSTVDILFEANSVNLIALFGPEHGVRGEADAGKYVDFYTDQKTNLPVFSLYGKTRKPSDEMLKDIDILIYDIQDIGTRSYTFISTMGMAMEAASENGIEFIVLDRPNPLGGNKIEGNIAEPEYFSFISKFPIPYVYGLTCGELSNFLVEEKLIKTNTDFKPKVISMQGWKRKMSFEETGLEWIPTSPHIPHSYSAYFYPMTGILGELRDAVSIGVGYTLPFQVVGAEWINSSKFATELNSRKIPGLHFRPITYTPYYAFGKGKTLHGVQIYITDFSKVNLVTTQFHVMSALKKLYPNQDVFKLATDAQNKMFTKAIGSNKVFELFKQNANISEVLNFLNKDVKMFREKSRSYYLYD
ncbi:MAG: DUF1343 domain-containing protein [Ignavibacteriae bacterium]|nr:DUF1343 domain-containing protein [Ignavibacteriota bacterium]